MNKPLTFLAIDIETTGPYYIKNHIMAIGYVFLDSDGNVLMKKRISLEFDDTTFTYQCFKFWSRGNNMDKVKQFKKDAVDVKSGLWEFVNDLNAFNLYCNTIIVSDNPLFDIGFINYYLEKYIEHEPIHMIDGHYCPIHDLKSYLRSICKTELPLTCRNVSVHYYCQVLNIYTFDIQHDHFPENDAEFIAKVYYRAIHL